MSGVEGSSVPAAGLSGPLSSEFEMLCGSLAGPSQQSPPHLARCFDAFPDANMDHSEDQHDAEPKRPADAPQVLEPLRPMDLQHVAPGVKEKERPVRWSEE